MTHKWHPSVCRAPHTLYWQSTKQREHLSLSLVPSKLEQWDLIFFLLEISWCILLLCYLQNPLSWSTVRHNTKSQKNDNSTTSEGRGVWHPKKQVVGRKLCLTCTWGIGVLSKEKEERRSPVSMKRHWKQAIKKKTPYNHHQL